MAENATELFKYAGGNMQELDTYFSIRRNNRKPLEENSVMVSYEALAKEMADAHSTIYKGQIVVTNGPKTGQLEDESKDSRFFMPWLIKNDGNTQTTYYADRLLTGSYTSYFLESRYVTKYQLGTKYTGVGQWADVKGTSYATSTYTEIFNDYKTNTAPIHEKDDARMPLLSHTHIEGYGNYATYSYAHVEGSGNRGQGRNVHVEGKENAAYGVAAHAGGYHSIAGGDYSSAIGERAISYGAASLSSGSGTVTNGNYSVALGKSSTSNGEGSLAVGVGTVANGSGSVAEGTRTKTSSSSAHAEGIETVSGGEASHSEGFGARAFGLASHVEGSSYVHSGADYSHAEGASMSYGTYSHAEGTGTVHGDFSHVEGTSYIEAGATYSHAEGNSRIKEGKKFSHSEGTAQVNGNYSHGEGASTVTGDYAHAEGQGKVSGDYAHAEGQGTASGQYTHAEGRGSATANYAHAEGQGTASGQYTHAEGTGNATADYAHAEGSGTTASGQYAHAEGATTTAQGESSHAEGNHTTASGNYAHAEGYNTTAQGVASHAEGYENTTTASGNYAHVEGRSNTAKANYSHIEGQSNDASAEYVHIEGQSNVATNKAVASHIEGFKNRVNAPYAHAEGINTYIEVTSSYSHGEGYGGSSYGIASHVEGFMSHSRGNYSHASGFCTIAPNSAEFSGGTYNRAYTSNVQLNDGVDITTVSNEFARLGGRYIAGRYPTGITQENASTTVAKYDSSYETIFTIGNGSTDNQTLGISPLVMTSENGTDYDAGQYVKRHSRHNIMDIRKNGQMYYDGGMIVGGEIVGPMSYSYVASLGPTAYFTTIMAALLNQPEYYRPSLNRTFTGSTGNSAAFNAGTSTVLTVEVGTSITLGVNFTGIRLAYDSTNHLDPIYGTVLGNMLGYSTGITNITYKIAPNNASLTATQNNNTFSTNNYLHSKDYAVYRDNRQVAIPSNITDEASKRNFINSNRCGYFGNLAAVVSIGKDLGAGKMDYFAYSPPGNKVTDTCPIVSNFKIGTEDTYRMLQCISYEYAPASQMYFQQLAEKGTYIGAAGTKPTDKWNFNEKYTCAANQFMQVNSQYIYYYGFTTKTSREIQQEHDAAPANASNKGWDAIVNGTAGYNLYRTSKGAGYACGTDSAITTNNIYLNPSNATGTKTIWIAVPACMFALRATGTDGKGYPSFIQYTNSSGTVGLDTGVTDHDELVGKNEIGGSTPVYVATTHTKIGNCKLQYRVFAITNSSGIAPSGANDNKVYWSFAITRKVGRTADRDMTNYDTPLAHYLYAANGAEANQNKFTK